MKLRAVMPGTFVAACLAFLTVCLQASPLSQFLVVNNTDYATIAVGGLRDTGGTGTFFISGVNGTITHAYLYWHGSLNGADDSIPGQATLNGQSVSGASMGLSGPNCWIDPVSYEQSLAFRADVTSLVTGNGNYSLAIGAPLGQSVNGASLLIFYDDGNSANNSDVYVFDGNDSNANNLYDGPGWSVTLAGLNYTESQPAYLQLHVSDAQQSDRARGVFYDDASLQIQRNEPAPIQNYTLAAAGEIFNGNAGSMWDVSTWDISGAMLPGVNNLQLSTGLANDCMSLVVAVAVLPIAPPPPPPPPNDNAPQVQCPSPVTVDCAQPSGAAVTLSTTVSDQDGGKLSVTWLVNGSQVKTETVPAGTPGITSATVSLAYNFPPGSAQVTCLVSDGLGAHDQSCQTQVTVTSTDTTPPTITQCAGNVTLDADAITGNASIPDLRGQVTATDGCTPANALVVTQDPAAGTSVGVGVQNVTITVRDSAGNPATCVAKVTVADKTPPVISSCVAPVRISPTSNTGATMPDLTPQLVVTDNVTPTGSLVITQSPAAGAAINLGVTPVTFTVKDAAGNPATCDTTIEVSAGDVTPPVITSCAPPATANAGPDGT
ncbi:MAG TPA: HYR domain-containing protein, partial [Verrucomicrobiae bacterium]|nr:HYR domain-containing protein [Verrucomicrobiae bacterium]